jgi:hypothetical protein
LPAGTTLDDVNVLDPVPGTTVPDGVDVVGADVVAVDVGGAAVDEHATAPQAHAMTAASRRADLGVRCKDDWCTRCPIVGLACATPAVGTIAHRIYRPFVMLGEPDAGTVSTP